MAKKPLRQDVLTTDEENSIIRACSDADLTKAQRLRVMKAMRNSEHLGYSCSLTGISPIVGPRYTLQVKSNETFHMCDKAYNSLKEKERASFIQHVRPELNAVIKAARKLKVTLLSGFLGAGKTTLLKRILRLNDARKADEKLNIAVIVNDMGEINLDADEIKSTKLIHEDAEMVEMHNGCICCTLRGDLLKTVKLLSLEAKFDYLVIESTGISEPLPVAQTFVMDVDGDPNAQPNGPKKLVVAENDLKSLSNFAELDTTVTVVDALNIFEVLGSLETLADKNNSTGMVGNTVAGENQAGNGNTQPIDNRSIAQLMLDQIEFANVIILSKVAMLLHDEREKKIETIKALLHKLCPKARILVPFLNFYEDLDVSKELLNTNLFNMDEMRNSVGWLKELQKPEHTPETEEYGVSSLVFRADNMYLLFF